MSGVPGTVGIYGKIEAQADFFRVNAGEFSQAGLDRWFESALETMRGEGGRLPEGWTAFMLAPRGGTRPFVGAFAPSTDAAGRSFPLVLFSQVDPPALGADLARVPVAVGAFVSAAGELAVEGGRLTAAALTERAHALAGPGDSGGGAAAVQRESATAAFAGESTQALADALGGTARALGYALRTVGLACDQASKYGPDGSNGVITVDAPAPNWAVARMWLEIVQRRLHWRDGLPSLLWTGDSPDPVVAANRRLLITLGAPTAAAFGYLANPRHRSSRFWPLRTEVAVALDQALQALSPEQRRLVDAPPSSSSLAQLAALFGT